MFGIIPECGTATVVVDRLVGYRIVDAGTAHRVQGCCNPDSEVLETRLTW